MAPGKTQMWLLDKVCVVTAQHERCIYCGAPALGHTCDGPTFDLPTEGDMCPCCGDFLMPGHVCDPMPNERDYPTQEEHDASLVASDYAGPEMEDFPFFEGWGERSEASRSVIDERPKCTTCGEVGVTAQGACYDCCRLCPVCNTEPYNPKVCGMCETCWTVIDRMP